jgi:hypothetical protein
MDCCPHLPSEHDLSGCLHGWATWDEDRGTYLEGCPCRVPGMGR